MSCAHDKLAKSFQISKCGCVGHSGINDMSTLIPQVFIGFKVKTLGRLFHPLHSRLNLALWGWALSSWRMKFWPGLWRYGIATSWRISPQYLFALRLHPIITCLFSEVDVTPPSHYLHQKFLPYQCTTQHNVLSICSTLWPYGLTARIWTLFRFQCICCRHQRKQAWW